MVENRLKMADAAVIELQGRVRVLEDSNKRGYEGYRQLEAQNGQLVQQLHGMHHSSASVCATLSRGTHICTLAPTPLAFASYGDALTHNGYSPWL